jgi:RimJ/RimL family protein N-acetyltransferase
MKLGKTNEGTEVAKDPTLIACTLRISDNQKIKIMNRQADPEASVWQIWMPGADRSDTLSMARPAPGQALPGEFFLDDGTPALIWPLLTTDAGTLRDLFRRLSPESRQNRFLQVVDELDAPMIRRLAGSVDGVHHIALLLVVLPPGGKEEPVGVARLLQDPDDPATADVAVTVVDDWQGRGAGTALVSALLQRRPAAVIRLRTLVAAGNRASLALLAEAGRVSSGLPEQGVVDVTVELPAAARPRSALQKVTDFWLQGVQTFIDQAYVRPQLPQADMIPVVDDYVEYVERLVKMNRDLTVQWAEAASALTGAVCKQVESASGLVREQAAT